MGYIKEPKGVDFIVGPTVLTWDDTESIRAAIAAYKRSKVGLNSTSGGVFVDRLSQPKASYVTKPKSVSVKAKDGRYHAVKVTAEVLRGRRQTLAYDALSRKKKAKS